MAQTKSWDDIHKGRRWGIYPQLELVRWVHRYWPEDVHGLKVLDIGCGRGANAGPFVHKGFDYMGIDSSPVVLEELACTQVMDARHLDFTDQAFDCIIDICCIQHNTWEDAQQILRECWRVLKPGGRMFSMMATPFHMDVEMPLYKRELQEALELFNGFRTAFGSVRTVDGSYMVAHWLLDAQRPA